MPYISEELMYKLQQDIIRTIPKPKYSRKDYALADVLILSEEKKDYSKIKDEDGYGINIKNKEAAHFIPSDPDRKDYDMMMEDTEENPYLKDKYDIDYVDIKGEEWEDEDLLRTFGQVEKLDDDQPGEEDILISENGELALYGGRKIVSLEERESSEMYEADEEGGGLVEELTTMNRVWVIYTSDDVITLPEDESELDDIVRAIKIWMEKESFYPTIWQQEERGEAHRVEAQAVREPRPSEIEQAVGGANPTLDQAERWIQEEVVNKGRSDVWLAEKLQALVQELRIGAVYAIGKGLSAGGFTQLLTDRVNRVLQQLGRDPGNIQKFLKKMEMQANLPKLANDYGITLRIDLPNDSSMTDSEKTMDNVEDILNTHNGLGLEINEMTSNSIVAKLSFPDPMTVEFEEDLEEYLNGRVADGYIDDYYVKDTNTEESPDTDLSSFLKDMLTQR